MKGTTVASVGHDECTGCMMCGDICPKRAIQFKDFSYGFWYPQVDEPKCNGCGLCFEKCPQTNERNVTSEKVVACYGAKTKNEEVRKNSTSGGFFSELASEWIGSGGICCGAEYDDKNDVVHVIEKDVAGIGRLRQSKYVQSHAQGIYQEVKKELQVGSKVLFCGTPCQVEALYSMLDGLDDNLLTLDFVCCGICSPSVYRKYLDMLEKQYHSKVKKVCFKSKKKGWRSIGVSILFENGKEYFRVGNRDLYMVAFVKDGLSMRASCHQCKYRKLPHSSDITIADFWGLENINPSFDDDKGTSAIIINSKKGKQWFDRVSDDMEFFKTSKEDISEGNFTVYTNKEPNDQRNAFLKDIEKNSLDKLMRKYSSYSGMERLKVDLNYFKSEIKKKLKLIGGN